MPTAQEIRAQLTGPGGPFEIVEETVEGTPMLVYKERFNDLRVVAAFGQSHGEKTFIVHGDERITFTDFMRNANSVSRRLGEFGVGVRDVGHRLRRPVGGASLPQGIGTWSKRRVTTSSPVTPSASASYVVSTRWRSTSRPTDLTSCGDT